METCNAKIASTMLGIEDHGIMTFFLHLEWSSCGQGFGGFAIDSYDQSAKQRRGCGVGITAIRIVLETVGVTKWEDLKGKLIRIQYDPRDDSKLTIGHILEEKWFDIRTFFKSQHDC